MERRAIPPASEIPRSPDAPRYGASAKRGFPIPNKKWDERCSTCSNRRRIYDFDGMSRPCPKCVAGGSLV